MHAVGQLQTAEAPWENSQALVSLRRSVPPSEIKTQPEETINRAAETRPLE
jgi:hypothetical protein